MSNLLDVVWVCLLLLALYTMWIMYGNWGE